MNKHIFTIYQYCSLMILPPLHHTPAVQRRTCIFHIQILTSLYISWWLTKITEARDSQWFTNCLQYVNFRIKVHNAHTCTILFMRASHMQCYTCYNKNKTIALLSFYWIHYDGGSNWICWCCLVHTLLYYSKHLFRSVSGPLYEM